MTQRERNEKIDALVAQLGKIMRYTPFKTEFEVKENPVGIRIIFEVTQEEMDVLMPNKKNNSQNVW